MCVYALLMFTVSVNVSLPTQNQSIMFYSIWQTGSFSFSIRFYVGVCVCWTDKPFRACPYVRTKRFPLKKIKKCQPVSIHWLQKGNSLSPCPQCPIFCAVFIITKEGN